MNRASKSKARLSYGHGNASGQILGEALKYRLNLNIVRVPYSSNPTALTDLLSLRSARILVAKSLGDLIIRGTGCARSSNSAQNTSRFCETRSRALKVLCTAKVVSD